MIDCGGGGAVVGVGVGSTTGFTSFIFTFGVFCSIFSWERNKKKFIKLSAVSNVWENERQKIPRLKWLWLAVEIFASTILKVLQETKEKNTFDVTISITSLN